MEKNKNYVLTGVEIQNKVKYLKNIQTMY